MWLMTCTVALLLYVYILSVKLRSEEWSWKFKAEKKVVFPALSVVRTEGLSSFCYIMYNEFDSLLSSMFLMEGHATW